MVDPTMTIMSVKDRIFFNYLVTKANDEFSP